eukprot:TRINITY_DN3212_c0_g1_i1.p1 TRINITY_DN3212_c0_g1~~TRINITY_DN3212_c0_g1_i1.p1  ORF type:complete len:2226 (+),score=528.46 TRINITY_DN3212_c0_g1_i1:35-6712(+)
MTILEHEFTPKEVKALYENYGKRIKKNLPVLVGIDPNKTISRVNIANKYLLLPYKDYVNVKIEDEISKNEYEISSLVYYLYYKQTFDSILKIDPSLCYDKHSSMIFMYLNENLKLLKNFEQHSEEYSHLTKNFLVIVLPMLYRLIIVDVDITLSLIDKYIVLLENCVVLLDPENYMLRLGFYELKTLCLKQKNESSSIKPLSNLYRNTERLSTFDVSFNQCVDECKRLLLFYEPSTNLEVSINDCINILWLNLEDYLLNNTDLKNHLYFKNICLFFDQMFGDETTDISLDETELIQLFILIALLKPDVLYEQLLSKFELYQLSVDVLDLCWQLKQLMNATNACDFQKLLKVTDILKFSLNHFNGILSFVDWAYSHIRNVLMNSYIELYNQSFTMKQEDVLDLAVLFQRIQNQWKDILIKNQQISINNLKSLYNFYELWTVQDFLMFSSCTGKLLNLVNDIDTAFHLYDGLIPIVEHERTLIGLINTGSTVIGSLSMTVDLPKTENLNLNSGGILADIHFEAFLNRSLFFLLRGLESRQRELNQRQETKIQQTQKLINLGSTTLNLNNIQKPKKVLFNPTVERELVRYCGDNKYYICIVKILFCFFRKEEEDIKTLLTFCYQTIKELILEEKILFKKFSEKKPYHLFFRNSQIIQYFDDSNTLKSINCYEPNRYYDVGTMKICSCLPLSVLSIFGLYNIVKNRVGCLQNNQELEFIDLVLKDFVNPAKSLSQALSSAMNPKQIQLLSPGEIKMILSVLLDFVENRMDQNTEFQKLSFFRIVRFCIVLAIVLNDSIEIFKSIQTFVKVCESLNFFHKFSENDLIQNECLKVYLMFSEANFDELKSIFTSQIVEAHFLKLMYLALRVDKSQVKLVESVKLSDKNSIVCFLSFVKFFQFISPKDCLLMINSSSTIDPQEIMSAFDTGVVPGSSDTVEYYENALIIYNVILGLVDPNLFLLINPYKISLTDVSVDSKLDLNKLCENVSNVLKEYDEVVQQMKKCIAVDEETGQLISSSSDGFSRDKTSSKDLKGKAKTKSKDKKTNKDKTTKNKNKDQKKIVEEELPLSTPVELTEDQKQLQNKFISILFAKKQYNDMVAFVQNTQFIITQLRLIEGICLLTPLFKLQGTIPKHVLTDDVVHENENAIADSLFSALCRNIISCLVSSADFYDCDHNVKIVHSINEFLVLITSFFSFFSKPEFSKSTILLFRNMIYQILWAFDSFNYGFSSNLDMTQFMNLCSLTLKYDDNSREILALTSRILSVLPLQTFKMNEIYGYYVKHNQLKDNDDKHYYPVVSQEILISFEDSDGVMDNVGQKFEEKFYQKVKNFEIENLDLGQLNDAKRSLLDSFEYFSTTTDLFKKIHLSYLIGIVDQKLNLPPVRFLLCVDLLLQTPKSIYNFEQVDWKKVSQTFKEFSRLKPVELVKIMNIIIVCVSRILLLTVEDLSFPVKVLIGILLKLFKLFTNIVSGLDLPKRSQDMQLYRRIISFDNFLNFKFSNLLDKFFIDQSLVTPTDLVWAIDHILLIVVQFNDSLMALDSLALNGYALYVIDSTMFAKDEMINCQLLYALLLSKASFIEESFSLLKSLQNYKTGYVPNSVFNMKYNLLNEVTKITFNFEHASEYLWSYLIILDICKHLLLFNADSNVLEGIYSFALSIYEQLVSLNVHEMLKEELGDYFGTIIGELNNLFGNVIFGIHLNHQRFDKALESRVIAEKDTNISTSLNSSRKKQPVKKSGGSSTKKSSSNTSSGSIKLDFDDLGKSMLLRFNRLPLHVAYFEFEIFRTLIALNHPESLQSLPFILMNCSLPELNELQQQQSYITGEAMNHESTSIINGISFKNSQKFDMAIRNFDYLLGVARNDLYRLGTRLDVDPVTIGSIAGWQESSFVVRFIVITIENVETKLLYELSKVTAFDDNVATINKLKELTYIVQSVINLIDSTHLRLNDFLVGRTYFAFSNLHFFISRITRKTELVLENAKICKEFYLKALSHWSKLGFFVDNFNICLNRLVHSLFLLNEHDFACKLLLGFANEEKKWYNKLNNVGFMTSKVDPILGLPQHAETKGELIRSIELLKRSQEANLIHLDWSRYISPFEKDINFNLLNEIQSSKLVLDSSVAFCLLKDLLSTNMPVIDGVIEPCTLHIVVFNSQKENLKLSLPIPVDFCVLKKFWNNWNGFSKIDENLPKLHELFGAVDSIDENIDKSVLVDFFTVDLNLGFSSNSDLIDVFDNLMV